MTVTTLLKLPEKTKEAQRQSKILWNEKHCTSTPDFYTIGYSGKNTKEFIDLLKNAGVATIVDIRFTPISRYKPEFSKNNLKNSLENNGIDYVHKPEWGIPRDVREFCIGKKSRQEIWAWYDSNILPAIQKNDIDIFFCLVKNPIALMCVEYDPTECHRHRLFLRLERMGLIGCDL